MVAWNTVITLVAEPWERHQQLSCLAGSASFSVEDFRTRNESKLVSITIIYNQEISEYSQYRNEVLFWPRRSSD